MSTNNELCPCGSGKKYGECCEPIIKGTVKAPNAEACMRARYTSYVKHEIDYIINSCEEGEGIADIDKQATEDWSRQSIWQGLHIIRTGKIPIFQSNASKSVYISSILLSVVAIVISYTGVGAFFGLVGLSVKYLALIVGVPVLYCFVASWVKKVYIRKFGEWI